MIRIAVDSASDITKEEALQNNIDLLPIEIMIGDAVFVEGDNLTRNEFYDRITKEKTFAKTSLIPPQRFLTYFEEVKEKQDEVIYIGLSSQLSGTFNSATLAKEQLGYESIYLVDSLTASYGIKVLVDYARRLIQEGKSALEIFNALEQLKSKITIFACLDTLEYLKRGGRINSATAFIGSLVNIKPIITISRGGKIEVVSKALGRTRGMINLIKLLQSKKLDSSFSHYVLYSYGEINCASFEHKLIENNYAFSNRLQIGPTIGTHIGPEAFGVVFVEK